MNKKVYTENIKGRTYVGLVPNQYTLLGGRAGSKIYTGSACLLILKFLSLNRLGQRIMAEHGKENIEILG